MPVAGLITLVAVALTVVALAYFLIHIILLLRETSFHLGTVVAGLRAIAHQTGPVGPIVADINQDLSEVKQALEAVLGTELTGDVVSGGHAEPEPADA
jgi:hypothetical protein